MLVMTAKVDKKKIAIIFAAVVVAIAALVMLLGGGNNASPTATTNISNNDARVEFLRGFGWDVTTSPVESSQVRIPEQTSEVFDRYNTLQKQQGYDLSQYAGKTVMRYVYKINNYPGAVEPVYATLLVYKNQVIGGDVTDTAAKGHIHGFRKPEQLQQATTPATDATDPTAVTE
ncbi:MAG: DUF4830 domain-containing protein [Oscillospiraceae bacterium]|nr:DUF4830 domain-containing protein [Oscillospiraceae bacterium]MBQ9930623.1 DUF4830 domain-containing protein [Oscillospiraceae bacterium]